MFYAHAVNFLSVIWFFSRIWRTERNSLHVTVGLLTIASETITSQCWPIFCLTMPMWSIFAVLIWRKKSLLSADRAANNAIRLILDETILEMRAGKPFRPALAQAIRSQSQSNPAQMIELWLQAKALGRTLPSGPTWWKSIVMELESLDRQAHQAVTRLLAWRARLKLESDFRRRCGQVLAQVQLQVIVLVGIYIAIFTFSARSGILLRQPTLCGVSLGLFIIGITLVLRKGGRIKWSF